MHAHSIAALYDSVSVCFSKGLGAPVGSALVGSSELIGKALRVRKMLGGGMRQAGVLAAGALYALDHHIDRLAQDHEHARLLAQGLEELPDVTVAAPNTNIVFVDLAAGHLRRQGVVERARAQGLMITGLYRLRLVTHLDVDRGDIDNAVRILRQIL